MDPSGTGRHTPPTTQPTHGLPIGENIQDARPRGGLFVTPDPEDDISMQGHTEKPINLPQAPTPLFNGHDSAQRIRVAQEAMKREILLKRKSGTASIFDGSGRAKIQRSNPTSGSLHEEISVTENADHNMDNHEEDHSWMDADNEGSVMDEREVLSRKMDALEKVMENNGELTGSQRVEYLQASQRLHTASRRLQKGKSSPGLNRETDDMDVGPMSDDNDDEPGIRPEMAEGLPNFTSQGEPPLAAAVGQKKPSRRKAINKTARDVYNSKQAAKAEAVGNKSRAPKKGKKQPGTVPTGVPKATYKSRMRNKWPEVDDTVRKLLASLIQSDTIKERMEQDDVEEGPDIVTANKANQLKELLSSIPRDYDANKARNEKKALSEASKSFGHGKVKAKNGKWLLVGMKTPLYHHQLLAADWMVKREISIDRPHGGLLADAMGLGKTVSTLATMVGNPPAKEDIAEMRKATLIVVPASLLSQWEAEIKVHVDEKIFQKVMAYKSSSRISTNILSDCDIVLTSFTEVANSWPFPNSVEDKADARLLGEDVWANNRDALKGDLQRVKWYRIVLDEAQAIKNYRSRTSIACHKLDSTYRWALSGTPVLNSLNELYPYFRFLRMNWASSFHVFKKNFGDPDANDSTKRLNVMLSVIMM
jgi:hypothetical protein